MTRVEEMAKGRRRMKELRKPERPRFETRSTKGIFWREETAKWREIRKVLNMLPKQQKQNPKVTMVTLSTRPARKPAWLRPTNDER